MIAAFTDDSRASPPPEANALLRENAHTGSHDGFRPFHAFASETMRTLPDLDQALASPLLAAAWAEAIGRFWQAGLDGGRIDPKETLILFDPAPGNGQVLWLLLRALLPQAERLGLSFRYIACSADAAQLDGLVQHPRLRGWIETGRFATALQEGADPGDPLFLRRPDSLPPHPSNPAVILARGWLGSFPARLYGVHYGQLSEGWVRHAEEGLEYRWQPCSADALPSPQQQVLTHCLQRFASTPVPLPLAAWQALDALGRLAGGRYLLLSADLGCWSEQQLRLGALSLPHHLRETFPQRLNHHALSLLQKQHGARTWNRQLDDAGFVLHAAWRDSQPVPEQDWQQVLDALDAMHPDDSAHLPQPCDAALPARLAQVRRSGHDPRVLAHHFSALTQQASMLAGSACVAWCEALRLAWENYFPTPAPDAFRHQLGVLAIHLGDLRLARTCFESDTARNDADALHALAFVESSTGNPARAQQLLEEALRQSPAHSLSLALQADLAHRVQGWRTLDWYTPGIADDELLLEPLGAEHAGSFLYQYRDPQIAPMARLPELTSLEQVQEWIVEQTAGGACYAVMHREHGFVGMTGLKYADGAGYFYFWIGTDFQGRGFGQRAARLTFRHMQACGVNELFTSVYPDNVRSSLALAALGFRPLPVRPESEEDDQLYLWKPPSEDACPLAASQRLVQLCKSINGPSVVPIHSAVGSAS